MKDKKMLPARLVWFEVMYVIGIVWYMFISAGYNET